VRKIEELDAKRREDPMTLSDSVKSRRQHE